METKTRPLVPFSIAIALFVAFILAFGCPQEALAKVNPWGSGTTYSVKTKTLTVKSGKHTIKSLSKKSDDKTYKIEKLVIKGGTTKLNVSNSYLKSLKVSKGKLTSNNSIGVLGSMVVTGGTVSVKSSNRYGIALMVSEDLTVKGGKVTVKSTKQNCTAMSVGGDMLIKKGSVTAIAKGKSSNGLAVFGFLKVAGGDLKSTTSGKYGTAIRVSGDLFMTSGSINASSSRDQAIYCMDLLKITGGTATAKSAPGLMAMYSGETAVVKPNCLGTISGKLPIGAQFTVGGVTYCVTDTYNSTVKVVQGTTSSKSVSFGGVTYALESSLAAGSIAK